MNSIPNLLGKVDLLVNNIWSGFGRYEFDRISIPF